MDWTGLIIIGGFFAFMYMFILRPQQQRQKKMRELYESLAPGDEIITIGGLHATLTKVGDKTVTMKVASGIELEFEKSAVGERIEEEAEENE